MYIGKCTIVANLPKGLMYEKRDLPKKMGSAKVLT